MSSQSTDIPLLTFTILDAARIFGQIETACEMESNHINLYNSPEDAMLSTVAPHLFPLVLNSDFGRWLLENGWGKSWGIFVFCRNTKEELNTHFNKFIKVKMDDGKNYFFRFYDPRVLRKYLSDCNEIQLKDFFGPVDYFAMEDSDPEFALRYSVHSNKLKIEKIAKKIFWESINGKFFNDSGWESNKEIVPDSAVKKDTSGKNSGWNFTIDK